MPIKSNHTEGIYHFGLSVISGWIIIDTVSCVDILQGGGEFSQVSAEGSPWVVAVDRSGGLYYRTGMTAECNYFITYFLFLHTPQRVRLKKLKEFDGSLKAMYESTCSRSFGFTFSSFNHFKWMDL